MSKMTKIIGILLAVCFVLSVTAAAASAGNADNYKKNDFKFMGKNVINHGKEKSLKQDGGRNAHSWNNKLWMWVWVPTHYENKVIKTVKIVKVHGHKKKIVVKKVIRICIPGHWELKFFKFNQIFKCNTRTC